MKDMQVESYDVKEVETKKQSLVNRAATAGGAIVLLFNLTGCIPIAAGGAGSWYHSCTEECECTECECTNYNCTCEPTNNDSTEVE